jgi:hypothetical protein
MYYFKSSTLYFEIHMLHILDIFPTFHTNACFGISRFIFFLFTYIYTIFKCIVKVMNI